MRAAREAAEKAAAQLDLGPFGECHKVEDLNSLQKGLHVSVVHRMSFRHFGTQPKDTGGSTKEGSTGRVGSHPRLGHLGDLGRKCLEQIQYRLRARIQTISWFS